MRPQGASGEPRIWKTDRPVARPEDWELAKAVLAKDRKATAEFVSRFADAVHNYIHWRLAPNADAAADLVQDVFLEAWKCLENYRGDSSLKQWMTGIARHKVQDYYRRSLRQAELPDETDAAPLADLTAAPAFADEISDRQRAQLMHDVLAEMQATHRFVLQWRYWDRQSGAEIAQAIGRTEKAVERLLARARENFRTRLEARLKGGAAAAGSGAV